MGTKRNPGEFDCYQNAHPDEPMFILLGRDPFAPFLVWLWALLRRLLRGRSRKVDEARSCAKSMRAWRRRGVVFQPRPWPGPSKAGELACIGCGMVGDGAYSFAEDHPSSIDVGPFCSQCFEGIQELVIRWHRIQLAAAALPGKPPEGGTAVVPPDRLCIGCRTLVHEGHVCPTPRQLGPRPEPPPNRVIREGDRS